MTLDSEQIIGLLKAERERMDRAIAALEGGRSQKRTSGASIAATDFSRGIFMVPVHTTLFS
jgi:flagellar biosynthesis regulator FlaF